MREERWTELRRWRREVQVRRVVLLFVRREWKGGSSWLMLKELASRGEELLAPPRRLLPILV